jgi:hypothetical protein
VSSRYHERLRTAIEVPQRVSFWGHEHTITPLLVPAIFGDGRSLVAITPLLTRPNYFVVRGDSSWIDERFAGPGAVTSAFDEVLEEGDYYALAPHMEMLGDGVYGAIEEAFGRWRDESHRDEEDTDADYEWPVVDLGFGCSWGAFRVSRNDPWGRVPERFRSKAVAS